MDKDSAKETTWLTYEQFLDFKRSALANMEHQPPDFVENLLHSFAGKLGYHVRFSMDTPWALDARIQIRSSSGLLLIEDGVAEASHWLNERAPSIQMIEMIEMAAMETRELETVALQGSTPGGPTRL